MACVVPAAVMTAAERACCKRMAHQCENKGMAKTHSCCQTTTVPDHLPAIKSSSDANSKPLALVLIHALPPVLTVATVAESGLSPGEADSHSPPVSPPVT